MMYEILGYKLVALEKEIVMHQRSCLGDISHIWESKVCGHIMMNPHMQRSLLNL